MNLTKLFLSTRKSLTAKLFEQVSDYDIYCAFIGREIKVGEVILSPIRKDNTPTFILFVPEDKDIVLFKDFAWIGGNIFKFVKYFALYQESINLKTRSDIIRYIDSRMGIGLFSNTKKKEIKRFKIDTSFYASKRIIKFKSRPFTKRDLEYWSRIHITEEVLSLFNVRSVHKLLDESNIVKYTNSKTTLCYVYVIFNKVKLYRPEDSQEFKWRNTCPGHYLQGFEQVRSLKSGNRKLIVTKSLKDVMVFYTFLRDEYDCIAPHSETYIFTEKQIKYLLKKYDEIIIIFDFDLAGVTGANRMRKQIGPKAVCKFVSTSRIMVNGKIKVLNKDISDFAEDTLYEEVYQHLKINMGL